MLGMLYLTGLRVPRDQAQAMMWFSRSVAQCNQYVQFSIEHQNTLRLVPVMLTVTRLPYHTSRFFKAHSLPRSSTDLHIEGKRRPVRIDGSEGRIIQLRPAYQLRQRAAAV